MKETNVKNILKNLPYLPGVYQFYDKKGNLLYIGKSVNLKSRVNSYFNGKNALNFAKRKMVDEISDIKILVTNNAKECLILETSLIKKHKPKYNILMKDDKNHTYIKITNDIFPKVIKTRMKNKKDDGSFYFGPYISTQGVNNILKLTKKIFGHRSCNIIFENEYKIKSTGGTKIPCIDYYIGRCSAPCLGKQKNIDDYNKGIENIKNLLLGNSEDIIRDFTLKMKQSAQKLQFEQAQKLKTDIDALTSLKETQIVRDVIGYDADIIHYIEKYESFFLSKIEVRDQKITGIYNVEIQNTLGDRDENIKHFIEKNYIENTKKLTLILPQEIDIEKEFLEEFSLKIEVPKIGEKAEILALAYKNALLFSQKRHLEKLSVKSFTKANMKSLLEMLGYKQINKEITFECNDISHISGNHSVASRSVMENGKLAKNRYKKFKIKTLEKGIIDDYTSHSEIAQRRILEMEKSNYIPDLIIIDGGKGQLSSVIEIFKDRNIQIIALAEKDEEIFIPGNSSPLKLEKNSLELRLLQSLRDEAHRFALRFNTDSRNKAMKKNILEEIPGIGPKTRQKLLTHYGSIGNIVDDENLSKILSKSQKEALENHGII